jgi:Fe-S-cluster containining protein
MNPTFEIPAGVRFTCSQCGDCCRSLAVLLGPGERERLAGLDWAGRADDLASETTFVRATDPAFRGRYRLANREGGACVYLGERGQCRIHEHFGEDSKPLTCRLYPFGFRTVGDKLAVDVAFSCRAVSMGSGAPVADRVDEWMRLIAERTAGPGQRARLRADQSLTPDVLWEIEHALLGFLAETGSRVSERVRVALEFLRLATTGDPGTPAAATMRAAMARALPARVRAEPHEAVMDDTQRSVFRQWLFLALNPLGVAFHALNPSQRDRELARRRRAALSFREGSGAPWIDGAEIAATFDRIAQVEPGPLLQGPEWIATFLSAKIVGQRFFSAGSDELPLVDGARILFLCHPMIAWTAKALAAGRGALVVCDQDVRAAIRLIDRTLGQVTTSSLPRKQADAFDWVMHETDLVACATREIIG